MMDDVKLMLERAKKLLELEILGEVDLTGCGRLAIIKGWLQQAIIKLDSDVDKEESKQTEVVSMRKRGYYFCQNHQDFWCIALWTGWGDEFDHWQICGDSDNSRKDDYWKQIDERRIERKT